MAARDIRTRTALFLIALCAAQLGRAQVFVSLHNSQPPLISTETVLRQMTQAAGVVFAGEVVAVQKPAGFVGSGQDASEGIVTVEFRVDEAVRGCTAGSIVALREWAGLWTGSDRYHVGQRLLVFLHSPARDGLSSPVGGEMGVIPLRGGGHAPGPYDASVGASEWLADLRWVQAQVLRGSPGGGLEVGPAQPARPIRGRLRGEVSREGSASFATDPFVPVTGSLAHWMSLPPGDAATQPLSQVLGLCRAWARAGDGAL